MKEAGFLRGISQACFPRNTSLANCFRIAQSAGFQGIELRMGERGEFSLESDDEEIRSISLMARSRSLEICSIMGGLQWKYPFTSNDVSIREKGIRAAERAIQYTSMLKAEVVLLVPGVVTEDVSYDVAYRRAQDAIGRLAEVADEYGVYLGIENVWNKFLLSPIEMRKFVDEIGHKRVGIYFDVGNILAFGYPEQWIRTLGTRIQRVHLKGFDTRIGNVDGFGFPFQGDISWGRVIGALREIGYIGYLTAEVPLPEIGLEISAKYISESINCIIQSGE